MDRMQCPRDSATLLVEHHQGIEVDHCPACNGRWLDHHELDELESRTAPHENQRRATIEYARRPSDLNCPVCDKQMRAFNYRAYNLELDTCEDQHGFWVDAGEEGRIRDVMEERVRGLNRAVSAEEAWANFLEGASGKSLWDQISGIFRGGRR